jgi:hypothetical protein
MMMCVCVCSFFPRIFRIKPTASMTALAPQIIIIHHHHSRRRYIIYTRQFQSHLFFDVEAIVINSTEIERGKTTYGFNHVWLMTINYCRMAIQNKKLLFLATKMIEKLKVSDTADDSVDLVLQNLSISKILESLNGDTAPTSALPTDVPDSPDGYTEAAMKPVESESSASKAKKRKRGSGVQASAQRDGLSGDEETDLFRVQVISSQMHTMKVITCTITEHKSYLSA